MSYSITSDFGGYPRQFWTSLMDVPFPGNDKRCFTQKEKRHKKWMSLTLKQIVKNWASFLKTKVTNHISPIYQSFKIQNFSSVYLQRNVRSTFQADIHSLNLTWLSPACVCSFFSSPRILSTYPIWNEFSESEKIILLSWIPRMKQHTYLCNM